MAARSGTPGAGSRDEFGNPGPDVDRFLYDGDDIILRLDGAGSLKNRYLHGPAVDQVLADEDVTKSESSDDRVLWALADHQGSVRQLVDNARGEKNRLTYDAFGQIAAESNTSVKHLYAYTGRERDYESHLQYNRARYYDAAIGKWISADPLGFAAGDENLYRYVGNSATNATDPTGWFTAPAQLSDGDMSDHRKGGNVTDMGGRSVGGLEFRDHKAVTFQGEDGNTYTQVYSGKQNFWSPGKTWYASGPARKNTPADKAIDQHDEQRRKNLEARTAHVMKKADLILDLSPAGPPKAIAEAISGKSTFSEEPLTPSDRCLAVLPGLPGVPGRVPPGGGRQAAGHADELVGGVGGLGHRADDIVDPVRGRPGSGTKKSPPNPGGRHGGAEHRDRVKQRADELEAEGHTIEAGGGRKPESAVETPGGIRQRRFPDIESKSPTGETRYENVGKQNASGTPVKRERDAIQDIEKATGNRPHFTPYNKP